MPSDTSELSLVEARRVALAAQGFSHQERAKGTRAAFRRAIASLGYIQLDPINVLCRMHYLTVYGRIGNYDRDALDRFAWDDKARELFEYWGHQASLLPTSSYALFRWRMERPEKHIWRENSRRRLESLQPGFVDNILKRIRDEGPMSLREIDPTARHAGFNWTDARLAVEWLFCTGRIAVHSRHNFGRIYDVTERVIPSTVLQRPAPRRDDAQRELIRLAASKLGVVTAADLRSFWFLDPQEAKARISELADGGELVRVRVRGWRQPGFMWHQATVPSSIAATTLLAPFDPLLMGRSRSQRLFGFDHRIEFYVPKEKRIYGYFVLPQLLNDELVTSTDVRFDRESTELVVLGSQLRRANADIELISNELADNLTRLAAWLGARRVVVSADEGLGGLLRSRLKNSF